jgi:hypothetical protein
MGRVDTNQRASWETLEGRTLLSATLPHVDAQSSPSVGAAFHVDAAAIAEPATNGYVTGWKNDSGDPLFGKGGPNINDIHQGDVGDCWFLGTLAEVAWRDPSLIRQDITERADGTYDVYFHTSTGTVDEHVDGWIPVNQYHKLEYAQLGQGNCVWVAIMEKALAYFRNQTIAPAYDTISNGSCLEALADLGITAAHYSKLPATASQLFSDVSTLVASDAIVETGTLASTPAPLVTTHVYSIISTRVTKTGEQEIELRNPWGTNPDYKASNSDYQSKNNGYLWISASTFFSQTQGLTSAIV